MTRHQLNIRDRVNADSASEAFNEEIIAHLPTAPYSAYIGPAYALDHSISDLISSGKTEKSIKRALQNTPSHTINDRQSAIWIRNILSYRKSTLFSFKETTDNIWRKRYHLLDHFSRHGVRLNACGREEARSPFAQLIASSFHRDFKCKHFIDIVDLFISEGCSFGDDTNSAPVKHLLTKIHAFYINERNKIDRRHASQTLDKYFLKIVGKIEYLSSRDLVTVFNDLRRDAAFCSSAVLSMLKEKASSGLATTSHMTIEDYTHR